MLEDLGLEAAVRALVNDFEERENMIASLYTQDLADEIPIEIATGIYRITQEALRNVAKHAGRTHVKVNLIGVNSDIRLRVTDLGLGFDMTDKPAGLGLINMEERARHLGGTFLIRSELGKGTEVMVEVPLGQKSAERQRDH
jgi:signal transduction histidine kinase